jgi:prepilin-type N-terminal cleavage/methylation domain-containing protein
MKTNHPNNRRSASAFTLIELLVVIAIIGVLAAMLFPVGSIIKKKATLKRVQTEIQFVDAAIQKYASDFGHNPPDNPDLLPLNNPQRHSVNQLFYELSGVKTTPTGFQTEDSANTVATADLSPFFGNASIQGFVNVTSGAGDEARKSKNCLVGIKPAQYLTVQNGGRTGAVLGVNVKGPFMLSDGAGKEINPIRYDASSTNRHNLKGFDLWVDILMDGKTNRINNWSEKPEIVP